MHRKPIVPTRAQLEALQQITDVLASAFEKAAKDAATMMRAFRPLLDQYEKHPPAG